jgi:hypothetical protein
VAALVLSLPRVGAGVPVEVRDTLGMDEEEARRLAVIILDESESGAGADPVAATSAPHAVAAARGVRDWLMRRGTVSLIPTRSTSTRSEPRMTETPKTGTEATRETIRRAFEAWQQGSGAITDVLSFEMVWRIERDFPASEEYKDRQQFIDEVLTPSGPASPSQIRSARPRSDRSMPTATGSSSSGTAA